MVGTLLLHFNYTNNTETSGIIDIIDAPVLSISGAVNRFDIISFPNGFQRPCVKTYFGPALLAVPAPTLKQLDIFIPLDYYYKYDETLPSELSR